ncbi:hypothetical protein Tco_0401299 [Tanacetum coccineum]
MKKTRILTRLYGVTPTIVLRRNLFKARHVTQQDYGVTTRKVYAVTLLLWKDELSESALRHHGFVGYPFDYHVTLGFGSIAGGLDHVNPVIRLPLEHGISRVLGKVDHSNPSVGTNPGPIPGMTPTQALTAIQTMADHSQKWHDGTSSRNLSSSSNTDGLAAIVSKLDNLGRDMKKLKENVHAIQVECQICKGPHLDK